MPLDTAELMQEALRGIPFFRDLHTLKALFAIERLWTRYPRWPEELRERALNLEDSVLKTARVDGLLHERVALPAGGIPRRRWRQNIEIGLFPIAYASIVAWHKAEGIENIVPVYKDWAVAAIGDLGHSWTIWCSFHEALPHLNAPTLQLYAAERFAEFVAQQFHKPGRTLAPSTIPSCAEIAPPELDLGPLISEALRRPGFLGHHLLTLGTLLRHRALLSRQQFAAALAQTQKMIRFRWNDAAFDIEMSYRGEDVSVDEEVLEERLRTLLTDGIDNVHTLTLADVAVTIWEHGDPVQRQQLCEYVSRAVRPDDAS